ncbi:MAG: hypothetical protein IT458_10225 [Planctomycetes bacterium]|nr:hypothetical protein [Planctomycetota bacterium]
MAVANPETVLQELRRDVARGLPPVVVLLGPSQYFRTQAFDAVLAALPAGADRRLVDGEEKRDGSELQDLRGGALFAREACLCVRRADAWLRDHAEAIERTLGRMAKGCHLVVEAAKVDKRTRLGKLLCEHKVYEFRDLYADPYSPGDSPLQTELVRWIAGRGKELGVPLTPEAAYLVLGAVGKDPAETMAELERLRARLGAVAKPLGPDDLRGRLSARSESSPFEFTEALLAGDRRRALRSLHAMFLRSVRGKEGEVMRREQIVLVLLNWLRTTCQQVLQGRLLVDAGTRLSEVPAQVGVRVFAERFQEQVRKNDAAHLRRGLHALLDVQRAMRTSGEEPDLLLERLVLRWFAKAPAEDLAW